MMNFFKFLFILFLITNLISCGNKEHEEHEEQLKKEENIIIKTETKEKDLIKSTDVDTIKTTEISILGQTKSKQKKNKIAPDTLAIKVNIPEVKTKKTVENKKIEKSTFVLKKILNESKIGETLTQKELTENENIPKDAIKLIKSITKISEDELEVQWQSTWLVEKVSDAKFKDGKIKLRFKDNTMYTSGNAIGIKYKKKIYTDLVVTGRKVRIPNIKGFYWEVGK